MQLFKNIQPLDALFDCSFCNHERTCEVTMGREHSAALMKCRICMEEFQTVINYLSEPTDVQIGGLCASYRLLTSINFHSESAWRRCTAMAYGGTYSVLMKAKMGNASLSSADQSSLHENCWISI
uniref:Transcription elongation factor 1 homolog n=1 Tax=Trichuris muris TaxID=70415 RepID=A0A5S6QA28_TRIMR